MLKCGFCEQAWHSYCVTPKLKGIPKEIWYCEDCCKDFNCSNPDTFTYESQCEEDYISDADLWEKAEPRSEESGTESEDEKLQMHADKDEDVVPGK